jgi:hypothetical protein
VKRNRRLAALLGLVLPVALWALSGLSMPGRFETLGRSAAPHDPDPFIQGIINQVTSTEFNDLDGGLSGEHSVMVGGNPVTFTSRYTPSTQGVVAEQYIYEYFQSLGLATSYQSWNYCSGITGRNVIAEIPGTVDPSRIYLITSHVDTISPNPTTNAKGADDNGTGTVAVMMAARILRSYSFDYTLRFVTFTGEERGLCGSNRYAYDARNSNADIRGVVNLDMIGYDSNNIKDVEIHAGTRADSQALANLFISNISTYGLNLVPHLLTTTATNRSDHASFWTYNYPAMLGIEYFFGGDGNPYYHSYTCCDLMSHVDLGMATDMTKAALATVSMLAGAHDPVSPSPTPFRPSTDTPTPRPTDTPVAPPTNTPEPPQPTDTPAPQPSDTPVPPTPCAMTFSDVQPTDYFYQAVRYLACAGAISGYGDGTFRPYNNTTRGQLSKIVVLAQGWPLASPSAPTFSDVPASDAFYQYVETAYAHGIISGYEDGTFRPGNNVTRGQLSKIVVLSRVWTLTCPQAPTFSDVLPNDPFYCYVETAHAHGIISGYEDNTFRPAGNALRAQISKIVYLSQTGQ